jgi:putative SOS response-associated peptidase YedK
LSKQPSRQRAAELRYQLTRNIRRRRPGKLVAGSRARLAATAIGIERSLDLARWGLVAFWAKDTKAGFANITAKAEGIDNRPGFRDAFQRRRCPVPVDNLYQWRKTATGEQSFAIALADRGLMTLVGL